MIAPMTAFGQDLQLAGEAIWKVLLVSLALGAGLPAVFALGIRSLAWGNGGELEGERTRGPVVGRVVAWLLFAVVAYGILAGLLFVIASGQGKTLDFSTVIPTFAEAS